MNTEKLKNTFTQILEHYWGWLALLLWGGAIIGFGLVRFDAYGLEETAARGLLLNWSIADNILNPIVTLGIPDFRALFFFPLGIYWPGSIIAAKVFALLVAFAAITLLHKWSQQTSSTEVAIIAAALFLISPLLIKQVDAMGIGIFLLLAFGLGALLDHKYRVAQRPWGGWFFALLIWLSITITLHPMGLAYPLALAWCWYKNPVNARLQRHIFIGTSFVSILIIATRGGWQAINWFENPFLTLTQSLQPIADLANEPNHLIGGVMCLLLLLTIWKDRQFLSTNPLGMMLLMGLVLGLLSADDSWALIVMTLILFRGIPYLLTLNESFGGHGLLKKRGLIIGLVFVLSTSFMVIGKTRAKGISQGQMSMQDELIHSLAMQAADPDVPFTAASQWPGRSMIACKRDVFPLPPAQPSNEEFLESIEGITHFIFDPNKPRNQALGKHIAELGGNVSQTIVIQSAGVIIKVRNAEESMTKNSETTEE